MSLVTQFLLKNGWDFGIKSCIELEILPSEAKSPEAAAPAEFIFLNSQEKHWVIFPCK